MKKNRFLSLLLLLNLLLNTLLLPCNAAPMPTEDVTASTEQTEPAAPEAPVSARPQPLLDYGIPVDFQVKAKAAALIELNSNTIAYGYQLDERIYPASLTKIMTCMLALKHGKLDDILTVSETALQNLNAAGSSAGLQAGEKLTLHELLYCVMISSANEACNVIAEYISGNIDSFVVLMNEQAAALGMSATHFANTHGLHDEMHYTTVRDLSTLARWAWQDETFQEISTTTVHTVPATNLAEERILHTTNFLVSSRLVAKYYYSKASGIKTGFTTPAGGCLITTASDGEFDFMSIICGCETLENEDGSTTDERFTETKRMFEYGFDHFSYVQVLADTEMVDMPKVLYSDGRENVVVRAKDNVSVLLPDSFEMDKISLSVTYDSSTTLEAPLEAGQRVGTVTALYQDAELASCDLITLTAVARSVPKYVTEKTSGFFTEIWDAVLHLWFIVVPLLLILLGLCILLILRVINVRKAKQRAMRARRPGTRRKKDE